MESAARKLDDTALCDRIKQQRKLKANSTTVVARQGEMPEVVEASAGPRAARDEAPEDCD